MYPDYKRHSSSVVTCELALEQFKPSKTFRHLNSSKFYKKQNFEFKHLESLNSYFKHNIGNQIGRYE